MARFTRKIIGGVLAEASGLRFKVPRAGFAYVRTIQSETVRVQTVSYLNIKDPDSRTPAIRVRER